MPPAETRGRKPIIDIDRARRMENENHLTRTVIAQRLGCSPSYLTSTLGPKDKERLPKVQREKSPHRPAIIALLKEGKRKHFILASVKCSYGLIQECVRELEAQGWKYAPAGRHGDERREKLATRDAQIAAERALGIPALVAKYGLAERTIRHILQHHQPQESE